MNMPAEGFTREPEGVGPENPVPMAKDIGLARPVTMAKVARAADCSQGAISSLLNDRDYGIRVSPKTREIILKTCRDLGYIPNDLRAFVRIYPEQGETCLMVSSKVPRGLENPFVARLAASLMAHAPTQPSGIGVIVYDNARPYTLDDDLPSPIKNGTASRILFVGAGNESLSRMICDRRLPGIVLGHSSQTPGTASVLPDYTAAARLALGLLLKHGHRHLGVVIGQFSDPEPRLAEMSHAIASIAGEIGIRIEPENVFHGNLNFEAGVAAVNTMNNHVSRPTALLCMSEPAAAGAVAAAHLHGIRLPEDLSIIAYADHAGPLDSCLPLTAVVLQLDEVASVATKEMDRQFREGIPTTALKIVIPVELIERSTCGPAKS